jgi:hypothetical protein
MRRRSATVMLKTRAFFYLRQNFAKEPLLCPLDQQAEKDVTILRAAGAQNYCEALVGYTKRKSATSSGVTPNVSRSLGVNPAGNS